MNSKIPLTLLGAVAISFSSFAETLTYDGSAKGSFYDGSYWGGIVPSETSDIVFDEKAKAIAYDLDATKGMTVNSITDNSITDRTLDNPWGKYIKINIGESTFTILEDLTLASNHNFVPFTFESGANGAGDVVIKGNIISKLASDGSTGESLFGNGNNLLKSVTVGGNIELQGSKFRFHALNVSVNGVLNFTGDSSNTQLNLCYGPASGQSISLSFGGLNGTNKEIKVGGLASAIIENSSFTMTFTNSGTSKFNGKFGYDEGGASILQNNTYPNACIPENCSLILA